VVDRVLGVALDQRAGDFRRLVEPPRPQLPYHERGSGNWRARLCTEHLFQRGETLLALTGIDLRSPDLCLDGWVIGIESGSFFELLQGEVRFCGPPYKHFPERPMSPHLAAFCRPMV